MDLHQAIKFENGLYYVAYEYSDLVKLVNEGKLLLAFKTDEDFEYENDDKEITFETILDFYGRD